MIKLPVYNIKGEKISEFTFETSEKSLKLNQDLIAQAVRVETNRVNVKPAVAKTRADVKGGGKKPWKQKGTGRARAGSIRSPLFKGGGVTFGPTGEKRNLQLPAKMRRAALEMLLFQKSKVNEAIVIDDIEIKNGKTKEASRVLQDLKISKKVLLVTSKTDEKKLKAWKNLVQLDIVWASNLKLADFLQNSVIAFTLGAADSTFKGSK